MKKFFYFVFILFIMAFVFDTPFSRAAEPVDDCVIKKLDSTFNLSNDSSMTVTENLIVDCGNIPGKHGIFRTLPTKSYKTEKDEIKSPVYLKSITDFNGVSYQYEETKEKDTITWKIGDPNITIYGLNYYKINYEVKNVIRPDDANFDEFYWNLNGAFWQLPIDEFQAKVIFPEGFNNSGSQIYLYSGDFGESGNNLATYAWENSRTLEVTSKQPLSPGEGITLSVTADKNIFKPYVFTTEDNNFYPKPYNLKIDDPVYYWILAILSLISPVIVFLICYFLWRKYGNDPSFKKTVVPEFGIPNNLAPVEMGLIMTNGSLERNFVTATIINLAVKGKIKIEELSKNGFFTGADFKLIMCNKNVEDLVLSEKMVLKTFFDSDLEKKEVKLSDLKYKFADDIRNISNAIGDSLEKKNLIDLKGYKARLVAIALFVTMFILCVLTVFVSNWIFVGFGLAFLIGVIFTIIMPRRTLENLEMVQKIKGFELYMKTAEKYRQKFNEKENILEKFLPYAILFGITDLWIKKMKDLYTEKYTASYVPVWYIGGHAASFNINNFSTTLANFSSNMSTTMASEPSASGAGGGGFSGGGGGGGGGGSW